MSKEQNFEEAYERLEEILEKMHSQQVSLDDSLVLYKEADTLVRSCQKRLDKAQQQIEILIKNREGNIEIDENDQPQKEMFIPSEQSALK